MQISNYKWFSANPAQENLPQLIFRRLGLQDYDPIFKSMRYRAENPRSDRADEIWLLSHKPVFTQGQAGKAEHVLNPGNIPVVQVDRGGQVTYHGPGQLVAYLLLDVRRRKLGVRGLVDVIERAMIETLQVYGVEAATREGAPGVYVNDAKIGALGLRVKNGWSYHGLSLNVNMDLAPFLSINPCGFEKLKVTQLVDFIDSQETLLQEVSKHLSDKLSENLGYLPHYSE